jgi:LysR family glycine cleavage system transcriptional activator
MRDLPPLNAIRVFESAARHLSFSRAADELAVTQSAVSRQIKVLEDQLGQPLFQRSGPKVSLTAAGVMYRRHAAEALGILRRATAELNRERASPTLTISVLPTFASRWLVPRVIEYEAQHPGIALRLAAASRLIDFDVEPDIDAAVRLGLGAWPGVHAKCLTALDIFPVCSPAVARQLRRPEDLARQRLLADVASFDEWPRWFNACGVPYQSRDVRRYDDDSLLLRAALEGQGVTLASRLTAGEDLDAGRLVIPFDVTVRSAYQYHFVCPENRLEEPGIRAFSSWLERELGGQ